ncbi:MAG: hypothetical protein U0T73_02505 [Chitinophagales bacterium]
MLAKLIENDIRLLFSEGHLPQLFANLEEFKRIPIGDCIRKIDPTTASTFDFLLNDEKARIEKLLNDRLPTERALFIQRRREEILLKFENGFPHTVDNILEKNLDDLIQFSNAVMPSMPTLRPHIPEEFSVLKDNDFIQSAVALTLGPQNFEQHFTSIISAFENWSIDNPDVEKYVKAERPIKSLLAVCLSFQLEKKLLSYLNEKLEGLNGIHVMPNEKIEWLGTQKQ